MPALTHADEHRGAHAHAHAHAPAPEPECFDLKLIAPQPWKNGAGLTREIAVARNAATEAGFDWRLSVAEVAHDAPFSTFPGVDRCIVLLHGAGLQLHVDDGRLDQRLDHSLDHRLDHHLDHRLDTPFMPFHFPGDVPLHATLLGGPSTDFNVMVRRTAWRAEVACHHAAADVPGATVLMLLACAGEWQIETGIEIESGHGAAPTLTLGSDQGLLWRESSAPGPRREPSAPAIAIHPKPLHAGREARLLVVRLCHDHAP